MRSSSLWNSLTIPMKLRIQRSMMPIERSISASDGQGLVDDALVLQRRDAGCKPVEFLLVGGALVGSHSADEGTVLLLAERHGASLPVEAHEVVAAALQLEAGRVCFCRVDAERQKKREKADCDMSS